MHSRKIMRDLKEEESMFFINSLLKYNLVREQNQNYLVKIQDLAISIQNKVY